MGYCTRQWSTAHVELYKSLLKNSVPKSRLPSREEDLAEIAERLLTKLYYARTCRLETYPLVRDWDISYDWIVDTFYGGDASTYYERKVVYYIQQHNKHCSACNEFDVEVWLRCTEKD